MRVERLIASPLKLNIIDIGWQSINVIKIVITVLLATSLLLSAPGGRADEHLGTPKNYRQLLRNLKPGDQLRLTSGVYRRGLPIHFLNGTKAAPIVIQGEPTELPAHFVGPEGHNTVSIVNSSYVTIRDLVLEGTGRSGGAVKAEGFTACDWAHHITLEGLDIYGYGGNQQRVGISTKCPAWNWVIRKNTIVGAGTGIYLGNSDGNAPFLQGVIEYNVIADTMGYNLQIKHQLPRGYDTEGMPENHGATIIRHNVFSKAKGAGDEQMARPNVLVGHTPYAGPGLEDWYQIYGNLFYQNPHEALFQGEGNLALYNNLFVNSHEVDFPAVAIQRHNWIPRRVRVFHNTVVSRGKGISLRGGSQCHKQRVYGNAVFAREPLKGRPLQGNFTQEYESASEYLNDPFAPLGALDLYPRSRWNLGYHQILKDRERFTDSVLDFNGSVRRAPWAGAYAGHGSNPGWRPTLGIKPYTAPGGA